MSLFAILPSSCFSEEFVGGILDLLLLCTARDLKQLLDANNQFSTSMGPRLPLKVGNDDCQTYWKTTTSIQVSPPRTFAIASTTQVATASNIW